MKEVLPKLVRKEITDQCTIGELYINDKLFCYTLEDIDRGLYEAMQSKEIKEFKIYGETAIPAGNYDIKLTYSPKFKTILPELLNVPGYTSIRIHSGNNKNHTLGCILVGYKKADNSISESKKALNDLMNELKGFDKIVISIG